MPALLDESGASILDEMLGIIEDENAPVTLLVSVASAFQARIAVTAQATMESEAGLPFEPDMLTLASAPWISMYPG